MKNKIFIFIILAILSFSFTYAKINIPEPTSEFFVNDFANVISDSDEKAIMEKAEEIYKNSGNSTQIVVVTVPSLDGNSIEEYANTLFNTWGIGSKEKNDGVLLLLAVKERESRIEVGYGLEGILNDAKTGRIQDDYMIPYYKNDNFSEGIREGAIAVGKVISGELKIKERIFEKPDDNTLIASMIFICLSFLLWSGILMQCFPNNKICNDIFKIIGIIFIIAIISYVSYKNMPNLLASLQTEETKKEIIRLFTFLFSIYLFMRIVSYIDRKKK